MSLQASGSDGAALAAIHWQVREELLFRVIEELISTNRSEAYRPRRN